MNCRVVTRLCSALLPCLGGEIYRSVGLAAWKVACAVAVSVTVASCVSGCAAVQPASRTPDAVLGLDGYYTQSVDWVPCGDGKTGEWFADTWASVECGQVSAPLDYRNVQQHWSSGDQTVRLAVARRPATQEKTGTCS